MVQKNQCDQIKATFRIELIPPILRPHFDNIPKYKCQGCSNVCNLTQRLSLQLSHIEITGQWRLKITNQTPPFDMLRFQRLNIEIIIIIIIVQREKGGEEETKNKESKKASWSCCTYWQWHTATYPKSCLPFLLELSYENGENRSEWRVKG